MEGGETVDADVEGGGGYYRVEGPTQDREDHTRTRGAYRVEGDILACCPNCRADPGAPARPVI